MFARMTVIALATFLLAADAPKEDAVQQEVQKLQGTWKVVKFEAGGTDQTSRIAERTWPVSASRPDTTGRQAPADRGRSAHGDGKALIERAGRGACRDPARIFLSIQ